MLGAMKPLPPHERAVTRRDFLQLGAAAAGLAPLLANGADVNVDTKRSIAELTARYLTPQADFNTVERGDPLPYTLALEKRREVGLERETWKLEVIADPQSNSVLETPLTRERGSAFTFDALLQLAEKKATRYLKVITCNNLVSPLGMGLWEGVPLRDVLRGVVVDRGTEARPVSEALPLRLPPEAAAQLAEMVAGEEGQAT